MSVYVNRTLNMKKIKAIGMDMDHTLVRYHVEAFEELTFNSVINKLINNLNYPNDIKKIKFDFERAIVGLVIDKKRGNLLKLSRYGKVKISYHGKNKIAFREQQHLYQSKEIDLNDSNIQSLDTSFSISFGVLYSGLVDYIDNNKTNLSYSTLADDIKHMVDVAHRDGTLKNEVRKNIKKYIIQDLEVPPLLERLKRYGKKLMVITNSDYSYTKLLLDYTLNPFLKENKNWEELFDLTVVLTMKPRFFMEKNMFLKVDPKTGMMSNFDKKLVSGIYQGGNAHTLQEDLGFDGDDILYIGDHIFGDILKLKKSCNWRTALVLSPLEEDIEGLQKSLSIQQRIDAKMIEKEKIEIKLADFYLNKINTKEDTNRPTKDELYKELDQINDQVGKEIEKYQQFFNPYWGETMRAGQEESRIAGQVEKYACIYMCRLSELGEYTPRTYFRPLKRKLAHEYT